MTAGMAAITLGSLRRCDWSGQWEGVSLVATTIASDDSR
jgi:hypothetical protein